MSDDDIARPDGAPGFSPKGVWYILLFLSSSFLLPSPVCMVLFTPLFPVFLLLMILPFVVFGFAMSSGKNAPKPKGYRFKLGVSMIAGAVVGLPFWFAVVKSIIGGRFL